MKTQFIYAPQNILPMIILMVMDDMVLVTVI